MNWMVAESAMFHSSCDADAEAEAEALAYAEHLRRSKKAANPVFSDASAAMAAEHQKIRGREEAKRAELIESERQENMSSMSLVAGQYGLPPDVCGEVMQRVGEPSGMRTFQYASTHQAITENEHSRREKHRAGVLAFEKRVDGYTNELASSAGQERRWEEMPMATAQQTKEMVDRGNAQTHATENKEFVAMYCS